MKSEQEKTERHTKNMSDIEKPKPIMKENVQGGLL